MFYLILLSAFLFVNAQKYNVDDKSLQPTGKMPVIGLGTWKASGDDLEKALDAALESGYRHIDTAYFYQNEDIIGKVLKRWLDAKKIKRQDLFVVTKLPTIGNYPAGVKKYLERSLKSLQLDYVDLYLIHAPIGFIDDESVLKPKNRDESILDFKTDLVAVWKAMEDQVDAGKTKAIGLSNFNISQIQRIINQARIKPSNLQVELHAYMQQKPLVEFCKKNNITVTAYSPLGAPGLGVTIRQAGTNVTLPSILKHPVVQEIAQKHNRTEAQVVLRHAIQKDLIVIPKSTNVDRVKQNFDVFSFKLDDGDMKKLNELDQGENGRLVDWKFFPGIEKHPEFPFNA